MLILNMLFNGLGHDSLKTHKYFFLSLLYLKMIKSTLFFLVFLFSEVNIHKSNTHIFLSPTKIGIWNFTAYAQLQCDLSNRKPSSFLHIRHTSTHLHSWETGLTSCGSPHRELPLTVFLDSLGHSCVVMHHLVTIAKVFWAHWPGLPSAIVFDLFAKGLLPFYSSSTMKFHSSFLGDPA